VEQLTAGPSASSRASADRRADDVAAARVLPPLHIGPLTIDTPVVLAPMAGVTNAAFRRLCRESGAGLYVAEMVTSRALVERGEESMRIIAHEPDEKPRSVQVYGVDPVTVGAAVRLIASEDRADHIDLNFGCPVPKVTRRGGGAALPWKRDLFRSIVGAAVDAASPHGVPVTVKMRKGIDDDHLTYLEAGLRAQDLGVAAIALHARTAADYYSGSADWEAIARLKETVTDIPVLGNGDIWSAEDALAMVAQTGCDGVVVGRGCQGRPWLFADLAAAFAGSDERRRPGLGEVARVVRRHAVLMVETFGDESKALREMRKHMAWYLKGYVVGGESRAKLGLVSTLAELDDRLAGLDLDQPYPGDAAEGQRGRAGSPKRPSLPDGWLDSRDLSEAFRRTLHEAELSVSGG
jgi:nifR3 family TIM-barrel protein